MRAHPARVIRSSPGAHNGFVLASGAFLGQSAGQSRAYAQWSECDLHAAAQQRHAEEEQLGEALTEARDRVVHDGVEAALRPAHSPASQAAIGGFRSGGAGVRLRRMPQAQAKQRSTSNAGLWFAEHGRTVLWFVGGGAAVL